jgi:hypothetical protein
MSHRARDYLEAKEVGLCPGKVGNRNQTNSGKDCDHSKRIRGNRSSPQNVEGLDCVDIQSVEAPACG